MGDIVHIPDHLSEEQVTQFIRDEITKRGGNPDTAYPVDVDDGAVNEVNPFKFLVKLDYEHYTPQVDISKVKTLIEQDQAWEKTKHLWFENSHKRHVKPVTIDYQLGFKSFGG